MPEFKVQCEYYGERENQFFKDKGKQIYHKFLVVNAGDLPDEYFRSQRRINFDNSRSCWLWIADEITKPAGINWERKKDYCFIMSLGEGQTAAFNIKDQNNLTGSENCNNMVLKTADYWKNTVQKISFWDSENYFYPTQALTPAESENKSDYINIILLCLPFLIFFIFLYFLVKLINKRPK